MIEIRQIFLRATCYPAKLEEKKLNVHLKALLWRWCPTWKYTLDEISRTRSLRVTMKMRAYIAGPMVHGYCRVVHELMTKMTRRTSKCLRVEEKCWKNIGLPPCHFIALLNGIRGAKVEFLKMCASFRYLEEHVYNFGWDKGDVKQWLVDLQNAA